MKVSGQSPIVSIIIPVYNTQDYLKECLKSATEQTFDDIEIICVDDGSTDGSVDIVKEFEKNDARVHLISQKNSGVSVARNTGIKNSKGTYILFLDADDVLDKDCVRKAYEKIIKTKSDIVAFGTFTVCGENVEKRWDFDIIKKLADGKLNSKDLSVVINLMHNIWDKLYRRDFLIENDIQFPVGYKIGEDGVFNILCYLNDAKYSYLPECLYNYRVYQGSTVHRIESSILHNIEAFNYIERLDLYKNQSVDVRSKIFAKYLSGCVWLKQQLSGRITKNMRRQVQCFVEEQKQKIGKNKVESLWEYKIYKNEFKDVVMKEFIKNIFSINNDIDHRHKVVTVLGMKFRYKKHLKKKQIDCFKNANKNSVMIFEAQPHHGECLPAYVKYFNDLGFHVDLFVLDEIIEQNPFSRMPSSADFSVIRADWNARAEILSNKKILQYKHLVVATAICYYEPQKPVIDEFPIFKEHPSVFIVEHDIRDVDKNNEREYLDKGHVITLWDFDKKVTMVNPCYFGDVKHTGKNVTTFICVGNIETKRKNHTALFKCVEEVLKQTKAFKVIVIGRIIDDFKIPEHLQDYIEVTGYLNFPEMFEYMEKADFFIPLLDASNPDHDRYITSGVSGSVQLILGFAKVPIIHEKFADFYGFDSSMALIFNSESFATQMMDAINMSTIQYANMQENLYSHTMNVQKKSLMKIKGVL